MLLQRHQILQRDAGGGTKRDVPTTTDTVPNRHREGAWLGSVASGLLTPPGPDDSPH